MPREFVPCLYHEWDTYDEGLQAWQWRGEVVEAFAWTDLRTRALDCLVSLESHAMHIGHTQTGLASLDQPPRSAGQMQADRRRLFDTFYAAMAALE